MTTIRDAVHGGIDLTAVEKAVLDLPALQRLRYVHQLDLAYLVYPGAVHTRFEHSLGTMHLAGKIALRLGLNASDVQLVRLAGLLHDVGHPAFSHTLDDVLKDRGFPTHEERGIALVLKGDIADVLRAHGISPKEVADLMRGKGLGKIVTDDLGADRMDYLLRDGHFTGVAYSRVDLDRLLETLVWDEGNSSILITEKGLLAAESLLVSRFFMFNAVYLHPAVSIANGMLQRAAHQALDEKKITAAQVQDGMDLPLLLMLAHHKIPLAKRLIERRLFKKALVIPSRELTSKQRAFLSKADAWQKLFAACRKAGFGQYDFVLSLPREASWNLKLRVVQKNGKIAPIDEVSGVLAAVQKSHRNAFIAACDEKDKAKLSAVLLRAMG